MANISGERSKNSNVYIFLLRMRWESLLRYLAKPRQEFATNVRQSSKVLSSTSIVKGAMYCEIWTVDEERQALANAEKHDRSWVDVVKKVKIRTPLQCYEKYRKLVTRNKLLGDLDTATPQSSAINAEENDDSADDETLRNYAENWNIWIVRTVLLNFFRR